MRSPNNTVQGMHEIAKAQNIKAYAIGCDCDICYREFEPDLITLAGGTLRLGDVITFAYAPSRWTRFWYAIRYMRHNNPLYKPPREFVVNSIGGTSYGISPD